MKNTYNVVVLAADGLRRAGVAAAKTNGGDGRALEADLARDATRVEADEAKEDGDRALAGLQRASAADDFLLARRWTYAVGRVAALDGAGVAVATADGGRGRGEGEGEEGKDGSAGEHSEREGWGVC